MSYTSRVIFYFEDTFMLLQAKIYTFIWLLDLTGARMQITVFVGLLNKLLFHDRKICRSQPRLSRAWRRAIDSWIRTDFFLVLGRITYGYKTKQAQPSAGILPSSQFSQCGKISRKKSPGIFSQGQYKHIHISLIIIQPETLIDPLPISLAFYC